MYVLPCKSHHTQKKDTFIDDYSKLACEVQLICIINFGFISFIRSEAGLGTEVRRILALL